MVDGEVELAEMAQEVTVFFFFLKSRNQYSIIRFIHFNVSRSMQRAGNDSVAVFLYARGF